MNRGTHDFLSFSSKSTSVVITNITIKIHSTIHNSPLVQQLLTRKYHEQKKTFTPDLCKGSCKISWLVHSLGRLNLGLNSRQQQACK